MRAVLTDGRIVRLEKECGCSYHEQPHWLQIDAEDKTRNAKLLDSAEQLAKTGEPLDSIRAELLIAKFAEQESVRLRQKERMMRQYNIARLLPDKG